MRDVTGPSNAWLVVRMRKKRKIELEENCACSSDHFEFEECHISGYADDINLSLPINGRNRFKKSIIAGMSGMAIRRLCRNADYDVVGSGENHRVSVT